MFQYNNNQTNEPSKQLFQIPQASRLFNLSPFLNFLSSPQTQTNLLPHLKSLRYSFLQIPTSKLPNKTPSPLNSAPPPATI